MGKLFSIVCKIYAAIFFTFSFVYYFFVKDNPITVETVKAMFVGSMVFILLSAPVDLSKIIVNILKKKGGL